MQETRTNMHTMAQFCQGKAVRPWAFLTLKTVYRSVRVPGISMRNQPSLPGRLKGESTLVLPMGYQVVKNWIMEIYPSEVRLGTNDAGEASQKQLTTPTSGNNRHTSSHCSRDGGGKADMRSIVERKRDRLSLDGWR